ncbi:MAG: single-stranded-DNA-specific exonuclease RecJ [Gemmatimonadota bacterium]
MPDTALASTRWIEPPPLPEELIDHLSRSLRIPPELCRILVRRGLRDIDAVRSHLRPRLTSLHPAERLPDVAAAVWRIESALAAGEKILVHGDYDADGMCAAGLLARGLAGLGADVEAFVPHRARDGYDLSEPGLGRAEEIGATLIVTADCGIVAHDAIARAAAAGRDVVVTDHHRPGERLPDAVAVVNPNRRDGDYPFRGLAGVGVAFKLLSALYRRAGKGEGELNQHLDLVAIGTVADQVPLLDENRVLVRAGLRVLGRTRKPGLRALLERAGLADAAELGAEHVAFVIAPRLNSVGRMGAAEDGLCLLLTEDSAEATRLAGRLEEENSRRRAEDRDVLRAALALLPHRYDETRHRAVVLWGDGWHPGVIGIAASRLAQRLHRPAIVVTFDGDVGRGSGRSFGGFHLFNALRECEPLLERYGGHRTAAGLTIRRARMEDFAARLLDVAARELDPALLVEELEIDLELPLRSVTPELHRWLAHLGPFGAGSPAPLLLVRAARLERPAGVGSDSKHLRVVLASDEGARVRAIGFGLGGRLGEVASGGRWDVAFELAADRWQGAPRFQARLRGLRRAVT